MIISTNECLTTSCSRDCHLNIFKFWIAEIWGHLLVVYFVFLRIANERIVSCGPSCLKFQPQVDSRGVQGAIALPGAPMFAAVFPEEKMWTKCPLRDDVITQYDHY